MDLKKGISYIAFGFLFTLVNLNLTINGTQINITPSFIGWLLIFYALGYLGEYAENKPWLKWFALILAIFSAAAWFYEMFKPELMPEVIKTVISCGETVFMFILFGILEMIAEDVNSPRAGTIGFLKYFNLIIFIAFAGLAYAGAAMNNNTILLIGGFCGIACLAAAIYTMFVLFGLRKEMKNNF